MKYLKQKLTFVASSCCSSEPEPSIIDVLKKQKKFSFLLTIYKVYLERIISS